MLQLHVSVHTYIALFDSDKPRLAQHQRYYTNIALKKWCNTLRIHVHDIVTMFRAICRSIQIARWRSQSAVCSQAAQSEDHD